MLAATLGVAAKAYIRKPCGAVFSKKVSKLRRRYSSKEALNKCSDGMQF
jgi:hypothetical protein